MFIETVAQFSETLQQQEDEWQREIVDAKARASRAEEQIAALRKQNRSLVDELKSLETLRSQLGAALAKNVSLSLTHARKECEVRELRKMLAKAGGGPRSETEAHAV